MTGGDAALAAEVLDEFITTTRADLDALSAACAAREVDDVRRLAHRIKGAARAVGAPPTAELAHQIESLAALGGEDWARFEVLLGELSGALEALVAVRRRVVGDSSTTPKFALQDVHRRRPECCSGSPRRSDNPPPIDRLA